MVSPPEKIAAPTPEKKSPTDEIAASEKANPTKESVAPDAKPLSKSSETVKGPESKFGCSCSLKSLYSTQKET